MPDVAPVPDVPISREPTDVAMFISPTESNFILPETVPISAPEERVSPSILPLIVAAAPFARVMFFAEMSPVIVAPPSNSRLMLPISERIAKAAAFSSAEVAEISAPSRILRLRSFPVRIA